MFLSLEDETGIANAIVTPGLFETAKPEILGNSYLLIDGILQNQQGVVSVKAGRVQALELRQVEITSHDFH